MTPQSAIDQLLSARRLRPIEALPWLLALAAYALLPQYLQLGSQILIMVLYVLSFDLLLGYGGIVTLGHAAYFGAGAYTAGLLARYGWSEPLTGLLAAGLVAGLLGTVAGAVILRTKGLALLMLGMAVSLLLLELANHATGITGGADGLQGMVVSPVLGHFDFDMFGKTAYVYSLVVLALGWMLVRHLINAPFGRSLVGIRQNPARMQALGVSVWGRRLTAFTISSALAGVAGALSAQTNQFVSLSVFSLELSGTAIVMLVMGGVGRIYGAFVGVVVYMVAQDTLSKDQPAFWLFWIGLLLLVLVLFNRGGLLGMCDAVRRRIARKGDVS
ncbi:branched-chain amino acid ABC transporter permease [Pigmentiphaga litoralis]|uniref:Branched-chain amino acid transport system permease protein n=1 Tax=Pigmentiphaga litoralis TaxID=516702 RepID=A0A7Y9LKE6_9BURK|nr:branched-chain amino acid ABC transporter permease [Pigmentiphaga litoralis]NYE24934.1 branched-chain amino acid transport system permease protein [Pigmentiphaga litoralis]NYE81452.1 branched-chain amino acid transport system permease protein [Pigmentiphaga litoralis]